jgi:hypothetical protein
MLQVTDYNCDKVLESLLEIYAFSAKDKRGVHVFYGGFHHHKYGQYLEIQKSWFCNMHKTVSYFYYSIVKLLIEVLPYVFGLVLFWTSNTSLKSSSYNPCTNHSSRQAAIGK